MVNDRQGLGGAMKDELGHAVVSEAVIHGEGRHQAQRMEMRERCKGGNGLAGRAYYRMRRGT